MAKAFEGKAKCQIKFVKYSDDQLLPELLKKAESNIDVIVGIEPENSILLQASPLLLDIDQNFNFRNEIASYRTQKLVPIDWAPLTFIRHNKNAKSTKSVNKDVWQFENKSVSLQDPRVSTTGQQFLWWWDSQLKDFFNKSFLFSLTPSWSASYGLFQNQRVNATFSYLTSLLYEWDENPNKNFDILMDAKGHPVHVEYIAIHSQSSQKAKALELVSHFLSQEGQNLLMSKNYMYPAIKNVKLSENFKKLPSLTILPKSSYQNFIENKQNALDKWKKALK